MNILSVKRKPCLEEQPHLLAYLAFDLTLKREALNIELKEEDVFSTHLLSYTSKRLELL